VWCLGQVGPELLPDCDFYDFQVQVLRQSTAMTLYRVVIEETS